MDQQFQVLLYVANEIAYWWFDKKILIKFNSKAGSFTPASLGLYCYYISWKFHDLLSEQPEDIGLISDGAAENYVRHYLKLLG